MWANSTPGKTQEPHGDSGPLFQMAEEWLSTFVFAAKTTNEFQHLFPVTNPENTCT